MPRYDFRCAAGHVTEAIFPMASVPAQVDCVHCTPGLREYHPAHRVFSPPAAIVFKGPGFYATDVRGTKHRRRRRNPGDDLHRDFQPDTAAIADAI